MCNSPPLPSGWWWEQHIATWHRRRDRKGRHWQHRWDCDFPAHQRMGQLDGNMSASPRQGGRGKKHRTYLLERLLFIIPKAHWRFVLITQLIQSRALMLTDNTEIVTRQDYWKTWNGRFVKLTHWVVMVMEVVILPLLVQFSHVNQTVLHLLQTPDLFPSTPPSNLNRWFAEHSIPLHTHTHTQMHLDNACACAKNRRREICA